MDHVGMSFEPHKPTCPWWMTGEEATAVVEALAATDPIYDYIACFFCWSSAPMERVARRLLGLPAWPVQP